MRVVNDEENDSKHPVLLSIRLLTKWVSRMNYINMNKCFECQPSKQD